MQRPVSKGGCLLCWGNKAGQDGHPVSWAFRLNKWPYRKIHIKKDIVEDPKFGRKSYYVTDYYYLYLKECLEAFPGNKESLQLEKPELGSSFPRIYIFYDNREQLQEFTMQWDIFESYLKGIGEGYKAHLWTVNKNPRHRAFQGLSMTQHLVEWDPGKGAIGPGIYEDAMKEYSLIAIRNGFWKGEFTKDERIQRLKGEKTAHFRLIDKKGVEYKWADIAYGDSFGQAFSPPGLYEILSRLGCPSLQGTRDQFSFTGVDGKAYEFSVDFVRSLNYGPTSMPKNMVKDFPFYQSYYLENGQEMDQFQDYKLEEMTGFKLERG